MSGRIRIGNQTAFSASYPAEPFEYAIANGFDAFEWFPDRKASGAGWSVDEVGPEQRSAIMGTAQEHDIRLSVHSSSDQMRPEDTRESLLRDIRFGREIGAALINLHLRTQGGVEAFAEALLPLWEEASSSGMLVSIENTVETGPEDFNRLFSILRGRLPRQAGIGICLDIGHANLCSATRNDYLAFVDRLDRTVPIIHIHLHENYGDSDSHLPFFTGPAGSDPSGITGLEQRLRHRGFSGCIILEQWPDPPHLLNDARSRLLEIFGRGPERGPEVPGGLAGRIVEADLRNRSWRTKLGWVNDLLKEEAASIGPGELAYLAVYLRFIGTGELPCEEEGGHHRPSHHARTSHGIYKRLLRIASQENDLIVRKIYPWLPSFDEPFQHAEPLTRIRDIAHRNDIPQDLKQEIKTTLQNKLHRSAGPEDLATSAALLGRITAPGAGFSPPFVGEFIRFHRELEEFFNAGPLDSRLSGLASSGLLDRSLVEEFTGARSGEGPTGLIAALKALVGLREEIARQIPLSGDTVSQRLRTADIGLEDFSFSLLSRANNSLLQGRPEWSYILPALRLETANLRLSGLPSEECGAIESELASWSSSSSPEDRTLLLRLRATVERCGRLADEYCRRILDIFPPRAVVLGRALGLPEHAVRVYAESDIRAHPVFQVSRLTEFLGREIRTAAGLPPWDVIVSGKAEGVVYLSESIGSLQAGHDGRSIAVVERIAGDEEIPAGLSAIITHHATPHLSHLAVRARQRRVVFAICEEAAIFEGLGGLRGRDVTVDAAPGRVDIVPGGPLIEERGPARTAAALPIRFGASVIDIPEATVSNSGQKASSIRMLGEISGEAGFSVPRSVVLPFGMMEDAVRRSGKAPRYEKIICSMDDAEPGSLAPMLAGIGGIIKDLELPDDVSHVVSRVFGNRRRLMVRSSATTEDLEGSVEAGIYRSVANVHLHGLADAVRSVWSSFWSPRAVSARRSEGMASSSAHMAVIIQEMIVPQYCFIIHTADPETTSRKEVYAELAVGLGEVLASGTEAGTPYRVSCDVGTGAVEIRSFASFSRGYRPGDDGATVGRTIDYSKVGLSAEPDSLRDISLRISRVGKAVESRLGRPQDIEGCISDGVIFLLQSRPQAGL